MDYTDVALDALRLEGDPLADRVIAAIFAAGQVAAVNELLQHLLHNDHPIPAALPPVVQDYLRATDVPPPWMDPARIARAGAFFATHGLYLSLVLSTAGLVECYAARRAVQVLAFTQQMEHPQRRVAETAQFCLHMMAPQSFGAGGRFIPAVQKVRLIHAAIRHLITASGRWDRAALGAPICQEDLLGALMLFTTETLHGLARLGVPATPQEAEDYYYIWRVTGVLLGIRADLIPPTLAEAEPLNTILRRRHLGPSPEGVRLTRTLLDLYERLVPGELFDGAIPLLTRIAAGDELADWMEVPRPLPTWVSRLVPHVGGLLESAEEASGLVGHLLDRAGRDLVLGQFRVLRGQARLAYDIPTDLRAAWGLDRRKDPEDL